MSLFHETDYKKVIRDRIAQNEQSHGYKTLLARAAGCQRSFFSQALHTHVHLTPEHAVGLAKFWNLTEDETEYFLELVNLARAATPALREILERKLREIQRRNEDLATRFRKTRPLEEAQQALYYSSWHWSAIHILLTVPEFRTPRAIAQRLEIPETFARQCLEGLAQMKLAEERGGKWHPAKSDIHLPQDSPLTAMNHGNWRGRAVADAQMRNPGALHYTALHSLSRSDFERIKRMLLEMIDATRAVVGPSKEEELACVAIDWFKA